MKAEVSTRNGQTFLLINGKRSHGPAYVYNAWEFDDGHPLQVVERGVRVVLPAIDIAPEWHVDGSFDTGMLDRSLNLFADSPDDLGLIIRFTITTPVDFARQYPNEVVRFAHLPEAQMGHDEYRGGLLHVLPQFASFASRNWQRAGLRYVDAVMDFVEAHPQGERVIGYMINTGESSEAILWGFQEGLYGDFSAPGKRAFREWLGNRYGTEDAFKRAHPDDGSTLATADPPSIEARSRASFGELRDPVRDLLLIDYDRFQSDLVVDNLLLWLRHARARVGADKLLGCFYGYCLWESGMLNGTPAKGHGALGRLLDADEIDFVTGITTYWKRRPGEPGNYMLPTASVSHHGKLHWNEDDLRTHVVHGADNVWARTSGVPTDEEGSVGIYRRQFARKLTENSQTWYYDIEGGMYDSPGLLDEFARQCEIASRLADADMSSCAEVACIVSELTPMYHRLYAGRLHQHRAEVADLYCDRVTEGLYRTGVPLDWYLSSDLMQADFSQYKVIYFFNQVVATNQERQAIERLKGQGRTLIFLWSAGFLTEEDAGVALCAELTGISMAGDLLSGPARIQVTDFDTPVTRELATAHTIGTDFVYAPLLAVADEEATVFGTYVWNDAPAAAMKDCGDWTSVYLGTCTADPELLRGIMRSAGCTVRCDTWDVILENRSVLGVHVRHAGPLVLRLTQDCGGLRDLYSGNEFMVTDGRVHVGYAESTGDTRLFLKLYRTASPQRTGP